jgi:SAM-dependent methyltransferase
MPRVLAGGARRRSDAAMADPGASPAAADAAVDARGGWSAPRAGERYDAERWRNERRRGHDPRLVQRLLARAVRERGGAPALVLDVPCGTGRLRATLEGFGRYVGADVSPEMLARARELGPGCLRAEAERLPFADGAFEIVLCCRLLHHLRDERRFERVVAELARVSSRWIVASFFDAAALPALRRRLSASPGRISHTKRRVRAALDAAGATPHAFAHTLRFFSRQTFVLARKDGA